MNRWKRWNARPIAKWYVHRKDARRRGIPFLLTFDEWWQIWEESGRWEERGNKKGQYCMARLSDTGPYAIGNVKIITGAENTQEACCGRKASPETRAKLSAQRQGHKHSKATIEKIRMSNIETYCDPTIRMKISKASSGRIHTEETKQKMRAGQQRRRLRGVKGS